MIIFNILLNGQITPSGQFCRESGRAGTGERVEHEIAFLRERPYQGLYDLDGFLVRVQPVARVFPRMDVIQHFVRDGWSSFRKKERLFMPVIQVS